MRRRTNIVFAILAGACALAVHPPDAAADAPKVLQLAEGKGGFEIEEGGAGNEQPTVTTLEKNGKRYVVTVYMSSDVSFFDIPWQCKCSSVELSATGDPKVVADRVELTHLFGDRPCNHPKADTDGEHIVWTFGSNHPDQYTVQTYAGVLDETCKEVSQPIRISANDNNNEGAPDIVYNGNGVFTAGYLSQGGQDISYARLLTKSGGSLQKGFLKNVVTPANIGRPSIVALSQTRSLFCAAKGDNRPPEDGVSCAMLDLTTGNKIWQELIAPSNPSAHVYMNQPSLARLDGGRVALQVIESDGYGKKKNKKGASMTHLFILEPNDLGSNVKTKKDGLGPYQSHAALCSGAYGQGGATRVGVFDASITGSGLATMSFAGYDTTTADLGFDKLKDEWVVGAYNGDSGYIANKYGQNPNMQGRDFLRCIGNVPNPGAGVDGGFMPNVKTFFAVPYTGRKPDEDKNALFLSFVPGHTTKPIEPEAPDPGEVGTTSGGSTGETGGVTGAAASGGSDEHGTEFEGPEDNRASRACSIGAGGAPGRSERLAALAGLTLLAARRRRWTSRAGREG